MDRLTYRRPDGTADYRGDVAPRALASRLAAYEETGLTPEEITEVLRREKCFYEVAKRWTDLGDYCHVFELVKAEEAGRLLVLHPEQQPSADGSSRPECFYTDKPGREYCMGYCCGRDNDEPIDACKKCWWCDGNDDFREEAEDALKKQRDRGDG